jgi:hypothetical protein
LDDTSTVVVADAAVSGRQLLVGMGEIAIAVPAQHGRAALGGFVRGQGAVAEVVEEHPARYDLRSRYP